MADPIKSNLEAQQQQFATANVRDEVLKRAEKIDAGETDVQLNPAVDPSPIEPGVEGVVGGATHPEMADVTENPSPTEQELEKNELSVTDSSNHGAPNSPNETT